ncbi:hypothetical protein [Aliamphritea spongicola]|nr:hypothetical protein [Aliamphritea spongicola]
MKLKSIQFSLALLCLLTVFGSFGGYLWLLETDAEHQSRQRADSYVEKVNAELDAYLRAQSRQLNLQASMTEVKIFTPAPVATRRRCLTVSVKLTLHPCVTSWISTAIWWL